MRIAIVSETYPPEINGVALTVSGLVRGLAAAGHRVQVVRPRQPLAADAPAEVAESTLLTSGVRLPMYPDLRVGLPSARRLLAEWRTRRPDAIYVATEGPLGYSALRAARALAIPAASGFHTKFDDFARHYGFGWLAPAVTGYLRRFHRRAQATLVPTADLRDTLARAGFGNVLQLRRAVDTTLFDPARRDTALRASWGLADGALGVIHVGRIAPEKNLALAVRAFRAIQAQHPHARFVWVGDGPARATLAAQNPDFIFAGVQRGAELARHYASADLFLFPSLTETFGNVTLEALASGVPTIAFDYGAAREHLSDACGRRVPFGNADAFVQAACAFAAGSDRESARAAARAAVATLDPQAVANQFAAVLAGLAAPRATAASPTAERSAL